MVDINIEIDNMEMETPSGESWSRAYQRKILKFCTIVLRDEQTLVKQLNAQCLELDLRGVLFTKISLGSTILHAQITNINGIYDFQSLVDRGKLTELVNDVIVTRALLDEIGVNQLQLTAHVYRDDIAHCRHEVRALVKGKIQNTESEQDDATTKATKSTVPSTRDQGKMAQ
jgi:hypothetical protein